jgi:hypothetical protein
MILKIESRNKLEPYNVVRTNVITFHQGNISFNSMI